MFKGIHSACRISRFAPVICLLLALMILAVASAYAHDPGLSAADLTVDEKKITARLTFARAEIAMIAALDANHDGQITQSELDLARTGVESLARESFAL